MNIRMVEVVLIDQRGKYHSLENIMVAARNIKFIHVPKQVSRYI